MIQPNIKHFVWDQQKREDDVLGRYNRLKDVCSCSLEAIPHVEHFRQNLSSHIINGAVGAKLGRSRARFI